MREHHNAIFYAVAIPDFDDEPSPFQAFDTATLWEGVASAIALALRLPASAADLDRRPNEIARRRIFSPTIRHHVQVWTFAMLNELPDHPFSLLCVLVASRHLGSVVSVRARLTAPTIFVSFDEDDADAKGREEIRRTLTPNGTARPPSPGPHILDHLVAWANIAVLQSVGISPHLMTLNELIDRESEKNGVGLVADARGPWGMGMIESAQAVHSLRAEVFTSGRRGPLPPGTSIVLTAPALLPEQYSARSRGQRLREDLDAKAAILAFRLLRQQRTYSLELSAELLERTPPQVLQRAWEGITLVRTEEVGLHMVATAVLAARDFAPVIRLPFGTNNLTSEIVRIDACIRSRAPEARKAKKLPALHANLQRRMKEMLGEDVTQTLRDHHSHAKILAHAPFEWLTIDDVPLQLRYSASRIPVTPGNFFLEQALNYQLVNLKHGDLQDILVIRSFERNDKLRGALEVCLEHMRREIPDRAIVSALDAATAMLRAPAPTGVNRMFSPRFVDVDTEADVVAALNEFEGHVVVFDCHGRVSKVGRNELVLADGVLDTWRLRGRARIPLICIISACDGHALQGTHASTCAGLLWSGAFAVVGTVLPVDGGHSADFTANLLHYLCRVFPLWLEYTGQCSRWSEFVTWVQRVEYCQEIARRLVRTTGRDQLSAYATELVVAIGLSEGLHKAGCGWLSRTLDELARLFGLPRNEVDQAHHIVRTTFPQCLRYFQFGYPDAIVVNGP